MKMKYTLFVLAVGVNSFAASNLVAAADDVKISEKAALVGMLPHQKRGTEVDANERNPFAHRVEIVKTEAKRDTNSEEAKIRAVLNGLRVVGITNGKNGLKAQVGSLILEVGRAVPQLIPNQTDRLRVTKVSAKSVEIKWIDEEGAEEPRKHVIDLDLTPRINTALAGSSEEGKRMFPIIPHGHLEGILVDGGAPATPVDDGN